MPLGAELAAWILRSELAVGVDFSSLPEPGARTDPLHVSQFLIDARSEVAEPLRRAVHQHFVERSAAATLTPLLLHLARTPGRLIVTLNYDDLIERAAEAQRIPVRSLTRDDIASVIAAPLPRGDDPLHVVHLHGAIRTGEMFVLDLAGYERAMLNADIGALLATIINQRAFCLLGTSFEEPYLRAYFQRYRSRPPKHVIVCPENIGDLITSNDSRAALGHLDGILPCSYPVGRHEVLAEFCAALVRCEDDDATGTIVAPDDMPRDPLYVGRRLLRVDGDDDPHVALLLGHGELLGEDGLAAQTRAVVVGVPGSGKSKLLRRLATEPRAGERAALVRLRDVRDFTGTPDALLTDWLALADSAFGTIAAEQAIRGDLRVHLLLDALDEQPPSMREAAADAISRVSAKFAGVRITVSSRPSAALDSFTTDWPRYELLCDQAWAEQFLHAAGTTRADLDARLGAAGNAVAPLLTIPFFLRRLTELTDDDLQRAVAAGDALSLIMSLLDRAIDEDPNLARVSTTVRAWLTDVAMWMQLRGERSVAVAELRHLTTRFDQLGDLALLTERLASRSLLEEAGDRWSFGHRLFSDALVAHALREEDPLGWLGVIAPIVHGRSALREDWQAPFALLGFVSERWRAAVAGRDPFAAARATPPRAHRDERRSAIRTLWQRATDLQVWIDDSMGGGHDDAATIGMLLGPGDLGDDLTRFEPALQSASRYDRANALDVLLEATPERAEALISQVLATEQDSTVRRNAASWARQLGVSSLADAVLAHALDWADAAEASDMASIALKLTDPSRRLDVGRRILDAGNTKVREHDIFDHAPPLEYVRWLRDQARAEPVDSRHSLDEKLVDLLGGLDTVGDLDAAVVGEALALAHSSHSESLAWVEAHPAAAAGIVLALRGSFVHAYEIRALLVAAGAEALAAAGADESTLQRVHSLAPTGDEAPAEPRMDREPTSTARAPADNSLTEVLDMPADERFAILVRQHSRRAREARKASVELQARMHDVLDELWQGRDLRAGVIPTPPSGAVIDNWAHLLLTYGPASSFPLTDSRWVEAATCGWLFHEQTTWLRTQATQLRFAVAATEAGAAADAGRFSDLLEIARDVSIDVAPVVARLGELVLPLSERDRHSLLHRLAAVNRPDGIHRLLEHDPDAADAASPLLAAAGDLDAQRFELMKLRDQFRAGAHVDRHDTPWLDEVDDPSMLDLLVEVVTAGNTRTGERDLFDAVRGALAAIGRIGGRAVLDVLDRIVAERPWPEPSGSTACATTSCSAS